MKYFNKPLFRKLEDLQDGLYIKKQEFITMNEINSWIQSRLAELSNIARPVEGLFKRLNRSWGELGESGDLDEIHHITKLFRDYLEQIVEIEEKLSFTNVPEEHEKMVNLLRNSIGSQAKKLSSLPNDLYNIIELAKANYSESNEQPLFVKKTITFELPDDWEAQFNAEIKKLRFKQSTLPQLTSSENKGSGCASLIAIVILILLVKSCI